MANKKKHTQAGAANKAKLIRSGEVRERMLCAATHTPDEFSEIYSLRDVSGTESGVEELRERFGSNKVTKVKRKTLPQRLVAAFVNPFTAILFVLAAVSSVTDIAIPILQGTPEDVDPTTAIIISIMVIISGVLRFVQESKSDNAADKLLNMITTTATVLRGGDEPQEVPVDDIVVGDIVMLSAGDMVPADIRIVEASDLFINQSSLTGESGPQEKVADAYEKVPVSIGGCHNLAFMGTNVLSGSGVGIVAAAGDDTLFGSTASSLAEPVEPTSFEKGMNQVSWVLIRFMGVMVPVVFFINGIGKGDWIGALLFAISIAVGLTPEMLPTIVTTCLAKGATAMSKKEVVVKNLNSIQAFGSIDVLCTDKTGTITQDKVILEKHLNVDGEEDIRVLRHGFLNSHFQTGLKNLMDLGIIEGMHDNISSDEIARIEVQYRKVDEIPFDFERRRLSVVVEDTSGKRQMVTKGAVEEMLGVCSYVEHGNTVIRITDDMKARVLATVNDLNDDGMRVIAVAHKTNPAPVGKFSVADENDMVLIGYLAFLDPPKESTEEALQALIQHGITPKILTGDNERVTRTICKKVGLDVRRIVLGSDIDQMGKKEFARAVEETTVFAKLSPTQKKEVVGQLRDNGHVVGFMGDGINDAPAMKAADIGISVDTAVDIAKESADVILLRKDLMVLEQGVIEGRKTYANLIKYVKMTASSNFGNMFSVVIASLLLPFLPMQSIQLVMLNLIYDLSCTAIPWDNVDKEFLAKPHDWDAKSVARFMIFIGPTSSVFDWTTYLFMYFVFCPIFVSGGLLYGQITDPAIQTAYMMMFNAGWFVESMWSQTLVIHMIRTPKIPFIQSRASVPLTLITCTGIAVLTIIPFTPLGAAVGLSALPWQYFLYLIPCIFLYMCLATCIKKAFVKRYGELL